MLDVYKRQDLLYDKLDQIDHWYSIFKENAKQYKEERKFTYDEDVITASGFAIVRYYGNADYYNASYSYGVRPAFCIS